MFVCREMLVKENAQVLFRRKQIINEMVHYIYPITQVRKHWMYIDSPYLENSFIHQIIVRYQLIKE